MLPEARTRIAPSSWTNYAPYHVNTGYRRTPTHDRARDRRVCVRRIHGATHRGPVHVCEARVVGMPRDEMEGIVTLFFLFVIALVIDCACTQF